MEYICCVYNIMASVKEIMHDFLKLYLYFKSKSG